MTGNDTLFEELLLAELRGLPLREGVERLFERGLVNLRACEELAIRRETDRLRNKGYPVCHALDAAAAKFRCSYAKARNAYYKSKPQITTP